MTANELRQKFLDFMKSKGHTIIPSASLVPENDPSVLFTTAGMHPLVPYLLGEKHPGGKRVANVQKCIRTGDIDDVGDNRHLTFFEMLGNWSFGDYFKEDAIKWSFEFLTDKNVGLGLDPKRLYVTVFKGEDGIPRDEESIKIWQEVFDKVGIKAEVAGDDEIIKNDVRIIPLGKEDNFWIAKETGPCGGDTEIFYDTRPEEGKAEGKFSDLVDNFRLIEIWNNVFMEFNRTKEGKYEKLEKPNVDTGMGIERTLAVLSGKETVFDTELFQPIFLKIEELSGKKYEENEKSFRIVADHLKAATFIISDGVIPLNVGRGYILRRLIRRAVRYGKMIGMENNFTKQIAESVFGIYKDCYKELEKNKEKIFEELGKEEMKFKTTLEKGLKEFKKFISNISSIDGVAIEDIKEFNGLPINKVKTIDGVSLKKMLGGKDAFYLFETFGFPMELMQELCEEEGVEFDKEGFQLAFKQHQEKSRTASAGMFKGGLADTSEATKKYHTAAHLMLAALRKVLGDGVFQKGSNITPERLRFDFSHPEKMTDEQKQEVEKIVNDIIEKNLPVVCEEMNLDEAKKQGAMGVFENKYGEKVKVYTIAPLGGEAFSKEICGGPHVTQTGELGKFKITKEESSSAGVRRIKAILE